MPTTTREQKIEKALAATRRRSSALLISTLVELEPRLAEARRVASETKNFDDAQALNLVRTWTIQVLEERYPKAAEAMEQRFLTADPDEDIDYTAELIAAIALLNA
jgi:hypothetical protein